MAKVIVIYDRPTNVEDFENYYNHVHIPLVQELPNLKSAEIHRVLKALNTEESLYLFAELHYESLDVLNQSLASPEGQRVQGDVANLMPFLSKPPVISITN